MRLYVLLTFFFIHVQGFSQSNIIPNFSFETGPQSPLCDYQTNLNGFDDGIDNWKLARHSNGKGEGSPDWLDYNSCGYYYCTDLDAPNETKRFVAIKADIYKCNKILNSKNYHEAICVSLPGNGKFTNGEKYIIRYKIMPVEAKILSGTRYANCINNISFCHLRFFLSEQGRLGWDHNSSTRQEIINANYQAYANAHCGWQLVERNFTCNYGNLTTLVLYAEQGGFLIDDVEIFERCSANYLIQNKKYFPQWYPQSLNFSENSGSRLSAGKNVDISKTNGNVTIMQDAYVTYVASDFIELTNGFTAEPGANFVAIIAPCSK